MPAISLATAAPAAAAASGTPFLSFARNGSRYESAPLGDAWDRVEFFAASLTAHGAALPPYALEMSLTSDGDEFTHVLSDRGPGPNWFYAGGTGGGGGTARTHFWTHWAGVGAGATVWLDDGFWTYQQTPEGLAFTLRLDAQGFTGAVDVFRGPHTPIRPS